MDRRAFLASSVAAAVASDAGAAASPVGQLRAVFDRIFAETLDASPQLCSRLGLDKGERAAAKSRLDGASIVDLDRAKDRTAAHLALLKTVDRAALPAADQADYDAVMFTLAGEAAAGRRYAYGYEGAGEPYVVSQLTGAYQSVPDFLATQHTIETKADADAYLQRLAGFAQQLQEETDRLRRDQSLGVIPPDFVIDRTLQQMKALKVEPAASPMVSSLVTRAAAKGIEGAYGAAAERALTAYVYPALDEQMAALSDLRAKATPDAGVWGLPDGEAYYRDALRNFTTTGLTPKEVHQLGLDQAKALSARAETILRAQGLTQGAVGERVAALFRDPAHLYPNTDEGKQALIRRLNDIVREMRGRLPAMFATLPRAEVEIRRVPPYLEAGAPGGYYNRAALDGSRPGIYWINLRDTAENPDWTLKTLTYHEAIPGHHLQRSLQQEADLPMLRKTAGFPAFAEGWALYAEQLAVEMGEYRDDPLGELGQIQASLFRAGRLVVDTGLHALRWSREKAIDVMTSIDGSPKSAAATEIERYCVRPGQACSYMVGKLTWLKVRAAAQSRLGPRFDIRQFHDAVLRGGAMPLTVVEGVAERWTASQKA
ncbi:MAG: DUF885 family protein [Caulobacterales bacterium]|nr:DUF885 family protein [Caulobacterales bacterium]